MRGHGWSRCNFTDSTRRATSPLASLIHILDKRPRGSLKSLNLLDGVVGICRYPLGDPVGDVTFQVEHIVSDKFIHQISGCLAHLRSLTLLGVKTSRESFHTILSGSNKLVELTGELNTTHVSQCSAIRFSS